MTDILNDIKADGNPRAASVRIGADNAKGYSGQRRHDLRIGAQPGYVDEDRRDLNRTLIEPPAPAMMRKIAQDRRAVRETKRAMKSNSAIATAGIITFGSEAAQMFETLPENQQDRALHLLSRAVAMRLKTSLHGLVVHRDEATIHAHFTLAAYDRHGVPLSKSTRPAVLSALQDLTAKVMQRSCPEIERGTRYGDRLAAGADFADVVNKSVKQLHRELPADLAAKQAKLSELASEEAKAKVRVDEMQDRVQKLEQRAELSAREAKRLETYQGRLKDRLAALRAAQAASEAIRAEADRFAALSASNRAKNEEEASQAVQKTEAFGKAISALSEEIAAGTIRRNQNGKLVAKSPDKLKPAYPEIGPAVQAAAKFTETVRTTRADLKGQSAEITVEREQLDEDRRALSEERAFVQKLRDGLKKSLLSVRRWLGRSDLQEEARKEGVDLLSDAETALLVSDDGRPEL